MKLKLAIVTASYLIIGNASFAHDGHDHGRDKVRAPNHGHVEKGKHFALELWGTPDQPRLSLLTLDFKALDIKDVTLKGKATPPDVKGRAIRMKAQDVTFEKQKDHFTFKVNTGGVHRYTLDVTVSAQGKTDAINFLIEPQS